MVTWLRTHLWVMHVLVLLALLLVHMFIFRGALAAMPDILQGNAVIVREELVPFFDFSSQFWPVHTSALTLSDEVRVLYSFWTSWMRYYTVLPFALVFLNTLSAYILFVAFWRIGRYFAGKRSLAVLLAAALAAFLIHFILLYAKVTHFYTLVFGFSMFALATTLVLEQLFFTRRISKLNVLFVSLLVLLNPGIHYHVIFYITLAFLVALHLAFTWGLNRSFIGFYLKRNALYFGIVTAASLLPYIAFLSIAGGGEATSATDNIPVNYWLIYYWSVPLISLFSLDTAAQIDMFQYGAYIIPSPRVFSMAVLFVIGGLFIMKQWRVLHIAKRIFVICLLITLLVSAWMAMGYSQDSSLSFHRLVGSLALYLTDQTNTLAQMGGQGIATFVNVLRFPHRFQFIFFYVAGILFMLGLWWIAQTVRNKRGTVLAILACGALTFSPILIARDYFVVLTSGNFAGFLQPYPISPDLKHIRQELHTQPKENRLFMLPSLESGRDLIEDGYRYGFIDKFFIYYLEQPTLYYGTDVKPEHKAISYAVYRAIEDNEPWWEDLLVRSLGVTHILHPKQTQPRPVGFSYMQGVDQHITQRLADSRLFTRTYDGPDFSLYQTNAQPTDEHVLVDAQWEDLPDTLGQTPANSQLYFPLQLRTLTNLQAATKAITDSAERTFYNLYAALHPERTFYPSTIQLAFSKDLVASSNFTNNALSMSTLNRKDDAYNYIGERMPSLLNTHSSRFIGVASGNTGLKVHVSVPASGTYRLLLHGASASDTIIGAVDNRGTIFTKIEDDQNRDPDYIDMTYFYADVELTAGTHTVVLHNPDHALAIEFMTAMPAADVPTTFEDTIDTAGIILRPTEEDNLYEINLPKEMR